MIFKSILYVVITCVISITLNAQSTFLTAYSQNDQNVNTNNFVSSSNGTITLLNNIYPDIQIVRQGGTVQLVKINSEGTETLRKKISSDVTDKFYDSRLVSNKTDDTHLVSIIDNGTATKIYVADLDENLGLSNEKTYSLELPDTTITVNRIHAEIEGNYLFIYGSAIIEFLPRNGRLFSIVIDLNQADRPVINRKITKIRINQFPRAMLTSTGWQLYAAGWIQSDSLMSSWTKMPPSISGISGQTQFSQAFNSNYGHGETTAIDSAFNVLDGGVITKLDNEFRFIKRVKFNVNSNNLGYRPGISSLLIDTTEKSIFTAGALGINRSVPTYPFSRENTTLIIKKFDEDLNEIFTRNYGGDAAYDIYHSDLLSGNRIAVSGFRYFDETDVMEGFLLVISSIDGTITSETFYPVQTKTATVFPNPTSDYLRITPASDISPTDIYRCTIIDAQGKTVFQANEFHPDQDLSVAQLPKGTYTLLFYNDAQRFAAKFVKQ